MTKKQPPRIIVPDPRTTQGTVAAVAALERAQTIACLVRDESADTIGAYLDGLDPDQTYALVTVLAALVPVDEAPAVLLEWLDIPEGATA